MRKRRHRTLAGDLYLGPLFRACLRAALVLTDPSRVFIVSAKHGLLRLDDLVEPYDERPRKYALPGRIYSAAERLGIPLDAEVTVLAPRQYGEAVLAVWPEAKTPLWPSKGANHMKTLLRAIAP